MKILLLNPNIDAEHKLLLSLQKGGMTVLLPADLNEATQMLQMHGESIDLAIIHREIEDLESPGQKSGGIKWIHEAKTKFAYTNLPIILTTEQWSDLECSKHQTSPDGVNAYLHSPFSDLELIKMIQAVFGAALPDAAQTPVLEDASTVFLKPELPASEMHFQLEAPPPPLELNQEAQETFIEMSSENVQDAQQQEPSHSQISLENRSDIKVISFNEAEQEMPYLYSKPTVAQKKNIDPALLFAEPIGNAIVPGGVAETPDLETFKKYLYLREQDVTVLSHQLKASQDEVHHLDQLLKEEKAKVVELGHLTSEQKKRIDDFEKEKLLEQKTMQSELIELQFQVKVKTDKAKVLEAQVRDITIEMAQLKERVRVDIRKIRVNERELENRLEIMKNDSDVLIAARDARIIELKRKIDLLEFNIDLLQDQNVKEKESSAQIKERLLKVAQVVRVVDGLLDAEKAAELNEILSQPVQLKTS